MSFASNESLAAPPIDAVAESGGARKLELAVGPARGSPPCAPHSPACRSSSSHPRLPSAAATRSPGYTDTVIASGFTQTTSMAFLPDGRIVVTELNGGLWLTDGTTTKKLADIPTATCGTSETGLLGIAVNPSFAVNGFCISTARSPARAILALPTTGSTR